MKNQAKGPVKSRRGEIDHRAAVQIARLHTFANGTKLKAYVESVEEIGQLKQMAQRRCGSASGAK